jgi:serine/threonine-protein kinase
MNGTPHWDYPTLPLPSLERIDRVCLAFEDAWQAGQRPRVEEYCAGTLEPERSAMLRHLLLLELEYRQHRGESPAREEYYERLPGERAIIDETFLQSAAGEAAPTPVVTAPGATTPGGMAPGVTGCCFGDYELLEEIARGGMGVVYRARQTSLNRIVAVKMILAGEFASEKEVRRFHTEAAAAAILDHPGIVPIYEVGEEQGRHFFSMGFVEGESLAARLARGPLPPHQAAQIVRAVAEAVEYAHRKGVIHRDLKPANILLDAASHPRISDFGLARQVTGESGLTASGQIVGTPAYMPPEQAAGKLHEIGPAADVYALGAVLYALLTGRAPFQADNPLQTLRQVLDQEPAAPRRLDAGIPKDLETICLKALDKTPGKRYRTAADLGADLGRYLDGFPIQARRTGPIGRLLRWAKRSRVVAASVACVAVLGVLAALFAFQLVREKQERAEDEARAQEQLLLQKWIDRTLVVARAGDFQQAEEAVRQAELLGASQGWLQMLRGMVAFHRGETGDAVQRLKAAVDLLPDRPAPRAMLAVAYWQNAQWEMFEETMKGLADLEAVTAEDYLFRGYAQAAVDPALGLKSIDKAIEMQRNWTIAHAMSVEARSWLAQDKTDTHVVEQALEDARIVKRLLPDDKMIGPLVSLYAHLVAATVYENKQRDEPQGAVYQGKRADALAMAKLDADALTKQSPASGWALLMRYRYLEYTGQHEAAFDEMRRAAAGQVKSPWPGTYYALGLYRRGDLQKALDELERLDRRGGGSAFQDTMRMYILAELPGRQAEAIEVYQRAVRRDKGTARLFHHGLLYLLGRKAEALAAYKAFRWDPDALLSLRGESHRQLLDYNCGALTADALLAAGKGSQYHQCNAHFFIGMSLLADGDRAGAAGHFRKCVETNVFDFDAHDWSRTFLWRIKLDPRWPRWISAK